MSDLLVAAALLWEKDGFNRWDDGEIACTVRMFDCALRVMESDAVRWALIHVQYDGPQPTLAMRTGHADPSRAPRPDMNIRLGTALVHVEAKRLHVRDGLPKDYVKKGMIRFIDGRYPAAGHNIGAMLAYLLKDSPQDSLQAVNGVISREQALGQSHLLGNSTQAAPRLSIHISSHGSKLRLFHHLLDMR
ncbi:hypothetical protein AB0M20_02585 [Actinoplanes sp. NPDC051633]|uniref:hypothetical protein n=1 Tax=Actinoplanes sp. NPDC051633 TaxID=3155670 RepID=UPI0034209E38